MTLKALPKPEALTKGDLFNVSSFSWSPNGARIAFTGSQDPDLGSQDTQQIYILESGRSACAQAARVRAARTAIRNGRPMGKKSRTSRPTARSFTFSRIVIFRLFPVDGGSPRVLTTAFDEDPSLIDWASDGIYFTALQKTAAHVFRMDPATKAIKRISGPDAYHLTGVSFTKDHRMLAGIGAMPNHFAGSADFVHIGFRAEDPD